MYKVFRIICCVISALLVAACVFMFIFLDYVWGICSVVGAAAFFALTLLFKGLQEDYEKKQDKPEPPPVEKKNEENKE